MFMTRFLANTATERKKRACLKQAWASQRQTEVIAGTDTAIYGIMTFDAVWFGTQQRFRLSCFLQLRYEEHHTFYKTLFALCGAET